MIRFNLIGFVMAAIFGVIWGIISTIGVADPVGAYIALSALFLMDVVYRFWNDEEGIWKWLDGKSGGFLGITPVWITAILLAILFATGFLD